MAIEPQQFQLMTGTVNLSTFRTFCQNKNITNPQKAVFLFPGNNTHHEANNSLYKIKGGGNLAGIAETLGNTGIPTLSLPTVGVPQVPIGGAIPPLASGAVADLWKAVGFGLHVVLPAREKRRGTRTATPDAGRIYGADAFFPAGSHFTHVRNNTDNTLYEPSLWGINGINPEPNPGLAKYYFDELNKLKNFMALDDAHKQAELDRMRDSNVPSEVALYTAYMAGVAAKTQPDPWFAVNPNPNANATQPSVKPINDVESLSEILASRLHLKSVSEGTDSDGTCHYRFGDDYVGFSLKINPNGQCSGSVENFDKNSMDSNGSVWKMIKTLSEKMDECGDNPKQLMLKSQDKDAMEAMKEACKFYNTIALDSQGNNLNNQQQNQNPPQTPQSSVSFNNSSI